MKRNGRIVIVFCVLCILSAVTGCASNETLSSEVQSGAKSRDKASAIQAETSQRTKDGEAVLNGK